MTAIAALILVGALTGLVIVGLRYRAEQRENARVRAVFSRYVAPPIVEELLRRKDPALYTGRTMHATVIVCRIWNFAGFAEELSAEETLRYLNEFFALAGTSIQRHRGMIDKFLADGIIGVFGVPLEDRDASEHAIDAALDIVRLVDAMDRRWRDQGRRSFQVGIGINSGEVIAGDAGFNDRREFTVVGPETLFAGRLQEATQELPAYVIVSASTCTPVRHLFSVVPLTGHPLPGLKRLVDAYIVLGRLNEPEPLRMPSPAAFKETAVEATVEVLPDPVEVLPDPVPVRVPLRPVRRMVRNEADRAFAFPRRDDDVPIMPDPPPPPPVKRSAYEDGAGPPVELPP